MSSVAQPFKPEGSVNANAPVFKPSKPEESALTSGLSGLTDINNDFTPSTPYVHKFRTEMCKNFELTGKCKYGDEVSYSTIFHF